MQINQLPLICVIEDNTELRDLLKTLLQSSNDFLFGGTFENAELAIQEIPQINPNAVLVDINLPGMSGVACVQQLKLALPNTLFLMCTAYADEELVFNSLENGASGYILKTEGGNNILAALKEMLQGGSPMSAVIARKVVESFTNKKATPNTNINELTAKENMILNGIANGLMNKEIAKNMQITPATVRTHIQNIYAKLHVNNRVEAVNIYLNRK